MKKSLVAFICFLVLTSLPMSALAHPGNTDANGGHTCRTNCEKWGLQYGQYHYHNGGNSGGSTGTSASTSTSKTGWQYNGGNWYYYSSGKLHKGWLASGNTWFFLDSKGVMQTGWIHTGGAWYHFNQSGAMETGWIYDGAWYYLKSNGAMSKGWLKDGGTWYYLQSSGAMKTGWLKDGNAWYYLKGNGAMKAGWEFVSGQWYYFDYKSGAMKTGWLKDGASWYFLNANGAMKTGWLQTGSDTYYLGKNGVMQTGWVQVGDSQYYFYDNGNMAVNDIIDGIMVGMDGKAVELIDPVYFKNIKAVADRYGYTVEKNMALVIIYNGDDLVAFATKQFIGGPRQYIDFLAETAPKIGAPETTENIKLYFDQITNSNNPTTYEREDFKMFYEQQDDMVGIVWGDMVKFNYYQE